MDFLRSQLRLSLIVDLELARTGVFADRGELLAQAGVTSLFLRVDGQTLNARDESLLARVCDSWQAGGGYVFTTDDALLALKLGCHGVFARNPRQSLARLREILGAERFLGLELSSPAALESRLGKTEGEDGLECVDFYGIGPVLQYGEKPGTPLGVATARQLTTAVRGRPAFWMGGIRAADVEDFGAGFADGVAVVRALSGDNVVNEARRLHLALGRSLGPTRFSVGLPPPDVAFRFSALSATDLQSDAVPLAGFHRA